jgi:glycosyltransferase involved in cell wall biosynthesis
MFSSVHPWDDGRIFFRELKSLSKFYKVELHAVAEFDVKIIDGIKIFGLPNWKKPTDRLKSICILWKRIYKSDADVFHFHDPELLVLAPFIRIFKRKPVIFDVHEHYPLMMLEKEYIPFVLRRFMGVVFSLFEWLVLFFIERVFYTTKTVGQRYIIFKGNKAVQVNNVPSRYIFEEEPPPLAARSKRAVFLGNMTYVRGLREIIQAFQIIHKSQPDYKLLLAGRFYSEEFKEEILQLIKKLQLEDVVTLQKEFHYQEMFKVLYDCRIGYITYLTYPNNMACLPNKMFEYMGAGLNIIASDFANYREVVIENNCGIVVNPEDPQAIAKATLKYIEDQQFANKMSQNARKLFVTKFNWEEEQKGFLNAYQELLHPKIS